MLPELKELDESDLRSITLEIPAAVITVLGVLEELEALRPRIVAALPTFDISHFDKLEDYALALSHINNRYQAATKDPDDLEILATEASKLRERYLAEARALTHHGIIKEAELSNLKGANGRKNVATDLGILVGILEAAWPNIQGKSPTTLEDLQHGSRVATRLQRIMGAKEQGPSLVAEVTDHRLRAYTQLMNVYESVQRAVALAGRSLRRRNRRSELVQGEPRPPRQRRGNDSAGWRRYSSGDRYYSAHERSSGGRSGARGGCVRSERSVAGEVTRHLHEPERGRRECSAGFVTGDCAATSGFRDESAKIWDAKPWAIRS